MGKVNCEICGKVFARKTSRSKYCSDKCRSDGNREKKRIQMKKRRADAKKQKESSPKRNIKPRKRRRKKVDLLKKYQNLKSKILANELAFGYKSRTLVEGIEIHDPNFEKLIIEKIKEKQQ